MRSAFSSVQTPSALGAGFCAAGSAFFSGFSVFAGAAALGGCCGRSGFFSGLGSAFFSGTGAAAGSGS